MVEPRALEVAPLVVRSVTRRRVARAMTVRVPAGLGALEQRSRGQERWPRLCRSPHRRVNSTGELREPETRAGVRFVELPVAVMSELGKWKLGCPEGKLDLCFPNAAGAPADILNFRSRRLLPALSWAGLCRLRVHDLGRGAASMVIAAGLGTRWSGSSRGNGMSARLWPSMDSSKADHGTVTAHPM